MINEKEEKEKEEESSVLSEMVASFLFNDLQSMLPIHSVFDEPHKPDLLLLWHQRDEAEAVRNGSMPKAEAKAWNAKWRKRWLLIHPEYANSLKESDMPWIDWIEGK